MLKFKAYLGSLMCFQIDLDTIDVSNLNRQFLFRREHVGKSKAQVIPCLLLLADLSFFTQYNTIKSICNAHKVKIEFMQVFEDFVCVKTHSTINFYSNVFAAQSNNNKKAQLTQREARDSLGI